VSIPSPGPQTLDFFGTPLAIKPPSGQLSSAAGLLPIRPFDMRVGPSWGFAGALDEPRRPPIGQTVGGILTLRPAVYLQSRQTTPSAGGKASRILAQDDFC
jgi:hypothetical protein